MNNQKKNSYVVLMERQQNRPSVSPFSFAAVGLKPKPVQLEVGANVAIVRNASTVGVFEVEGNITDVEQVRSSPGVLGVFPNLVYSPAVVQFPRPHPPVSAGFTASSTQSSNHYFKVRVMSATNQPISGVEVLAWTDNAEEGDSGFTDAGGEVTLKLHKRKILRLCGSLANFWTFEARNVSVASTPFEMTLDPIQVGHNCVIQHFMPRSDGKNGRDVVVAIVDSGIDRHVDLKNVAGGANLSGDGDPSYLDNGIWHGTHVAGIVGANGTMVGVAPQVTLRSYRVFPTGSGETDTASIAAAIGQAIDDQVDIINLSLGGGGYDAALELAVNQALESGILVIAAAGNCGKAVQYPANLQGVVAVSAAGNLAKVSPTSSHSTTPHHELAKTGDFVAAFSCFGMEIASTGPGVGVVSTVERSDYVAWDGTSMSAPAVTGIAARILSDNPTLLKAKRDRNRAEALRQELYSSCRSLSLKQVYEGHGVPS